jgi:histidine triad (HIT) family protein
MYDENCLFCKIVDRKIPAKIAYEDDHVLAFHDIAPQAPVHILLIPKKHLSTLNDLTPADTDMMGRLIYQAQHLAKNLNFSENGYRLVMNCNADGGQTVFHIHLHLLAGRTLTWPPG